MMTMTTTTMTAKTKAKIAVTELPHRCSPAFASSPKQDPAPNLGPEQRHEVPTRKCADGLAPLPRRPPAAPQLEHGGRATGRRSCRRESSAWRGSGGGLDSVLTTLLVFETWLVTRGKGYGKGGREGRSAHFVASAWLARCIFNGSRRVAAMERETSARAASASSSR